MSRRALIVALITSGTVLLVSAVLYGRTHTEALQPSSSDPLAAESVSYPAPRFAAETLDGATVSLADFRGKTLVVNFFADWCVPCAKEAPVLTSFARDAGPNTVMLSIARDSTRGGARSFARRHGLDWTILFDSGDHLTDAFRIVGQPATFVIDGRGRIVWKKLGPVTRTMLTDAARRA